MAQKDLLEESADRAVEVVGFRGRRERRRCDECGSQ